LLLDLFLANFPTGVIIVKKLVSLVLILSVLSCNFSALAIRDCQACNNVVNLAVRGCQTCSNVNSVSKNELEKENKSAACEAEKYSGKVTRVVKAVLSTGIVLGTFAGVKILSSVLSTSGSKVAKFAGKTLIGVAGACAAIASIINSGANLSEISKAAYYGDTGKVNQFCFGLNMVNVAASFYTLKYILSGQIFSGNSLKISIGL
jgi:hypothetical protein